MEFTVDQLANHLEDILTWRQLRRLAKRNRISQYSYLGKKQLAQLLAINTFNKAQRHAIPNPKQ
jgi:primosomal protein N''